MRTCLAASARVTPVIAWTIAAGVRCPSRCANPAYPRSRWERLATTPAIIDTSVSASARKPDTSRNRQVSASSSSASTPRTVDRFSAACGGKDARRTAQRRPHSHNQRGYIGPTVSDSPSEARSTRTASPSRTAPSSSATASLSSISRCIRRRSGRAP